MSRDNIKLLVVAAFCLTIGLAGPALAHGVNHALFAHNADKVDGKHANAVTRIARTQAHASFDDSEDVIGTLTMKVPSKGGLVLVNSAVNVYSDSRDAALCRLIGPEGQASWPVAGAPGDGLNEYGVANTFAFRTTADPGTTVAVQAKCRTTSGTAQGWVDMTGIWSPFSSTGGAPTALP